jgi:hypothetical protein
MSPKIQGALKKKKPNDLLQALMGAIPYAQPSDFPRLNSNGKLIVCCHCFAFEMFSGGYLMVLENLPEWTNEIVESLRRIGAEPYAERFAKVVRLAKKNRLAPFSDTDWSEYLEKHPDFELEMVRDYERVVDVVADRLRAYIQKHASTFAA